MLIGNLMTNLRWISKLDKRRFWILQNYLSKWLCLMSNLWVTVFYDLFKDFSLILISNYFFCYFHEEPSSRKYSSLNSFWIRCWIHWYFRSNCKELLYFSYNFFQRQPKRQIIIVLQIKLFFGPISQGIQILFILWISLLPFSFTFPQISNVLGEVVEPMKDCYL